MASASHNIIALTMGEPAGIGPELIARLWQERYILKLPPIIYVGSSTALYAVDQSLPLNIVDEQSFTATHAIPDDQLTVFEIAAKNPITIGQMDPDNGACVIQSINSAVSLARDGHVAAIVTAPIHKAGLYRTGFDAPGHTEYLARLCGLNDDQSVMMLTAQDLRVVPVTVHVPHKDVVKHLTADKIVHAGIVTAHDLRHKFNIPNPRIAVAGLNPHAGESGTIGMEEATHILPAIWTLREHGVNVTDPLPADTLFHADARKNFDAVLCMYHDQALIPLKTLDFWGGVNVTLGLPIIRTSPDHGTALELAGTGKARTDSMLAAIRMATEMAERSSQRETA